jgi:hypothetical protein
LVFGIFLNSCSGGHKFSTIGKEYDLLLFADNEFYNAREDMILDNLSNKVFFTHSESIFKIMKKNIEKASRMKKYKNIVFIDNIMTTEDVTTYITDVLGSDKVYETKDVTIAHKENMWAEGQTVVFLLFAGDVITEDDIEKAVEKAGDIVEKDVQKRIEDELFKEDTNSELVKKAKERFDFKLHIPKRYFSFKEKDDFLSVVTRAPDRLFFFYSEEYSASKQVNEENAVKLRNKVTGMYYDGDVVFTEMKEWKKESPDKNYFYNFEKIDYKGNSFYKLQGLWENNENIRGGVFVTYYYHDKENNKIYLIDAMLHNPGEPKWPYINKMSMIQRKNTELIIDQINQKKKE